VILPLRGSGIVLADVRTISSPLTAPIYGHPFARTWLLIQIGACQDRNANRSPGHQECPVGQQRLRVVLLDVVSVVAVNVPVFGRENPRREHHAPLYPRRRGPVRWGQQRRV